MADIGRRLKRKREALGFTLAEAAQLSGIGNYQMIYKIEHGLRKIKAHELAALAKAYSFDLNMFLLEEKPADQVKFSWRAERMPKQANRIKARSKMFFERYFHLQELLGYETSGTKLSRITRQITSVYDASEEGEKYSNWLKLGDRPALTFKRILEEEYNLPIFFDKMPKGISAIAIISENYSAIFINTEDAPCRRNFDIAHELFHIIYQQDIPDKCYRSSSKTGEMLANAFASAFLLPRNSIERDINKRKERSTINVSDLVIMACDYDVSLDALLWRLVNLNRIDRDRVNEILNIDSFKEYYYNLRKVKPELTPYISEKYVCLVYDAVKQGKMSRMRAAEYLDISLSELDETFEHAGLTWEGNIEIEINK